MRQDRNTFDEPVTTFTEADVSVTNGSASTPTGSGASYAATITPAADGDVIVRVDLTGFLSFAKRSVT